MQRHVVVNAPDNKKIKTDYNLLKRTPTPFQSMLHMERYAALVKKCAHAEFFNRYGLIPQNLADLTSTFNAGNSNKVINVSSAQHNAVPINAILPSFPFNYIRGSDQQSLKVFTDIFKSAGVLFVFMPGPSTLTCNDIHLPSFANLAKLYALKAHGVDCVVIVTPGIPEVACSWVRRIFSSAHLEDCIPDTLPTESLDAEDFRVKYQNEERSDLPTVLVMADQTLAFANYLGLVTEDTDDGLCCKRASAYYQNNILALIRIAEDLGSDTCGPILAGAIDEDLQRLRDIRDQARAARP